MTPTTESKAITIVKCRCGDAVCHTHGLSDGIFYQGSGWPKERAQQYADAINSHAANLREIARLREALRTFGYHTDDCDFYAYVKGVVKSAADCDCGLTAALAQPVGEGGSDG